jgi:hypothetical protein
MDPLLSFSLPNDSSFFFYFTPLSSFFLLLSVYPLLFCSSLSSLYILSTLSGLSSHCQAFNSFLLFILLTSSLPLSSLFPLLSPSSYHFFSFKPLLRIYFILLLSLSACFIFLDMTQYDLIIFIFLLQYCIHSLILHCQRDVSCC